PLALALVAASAHAGETPLERAVLDFRAGRFSAVVEAREHLPADTHQRARVQYLVGEALLVLDRPGEAERAFADVLDLRPAAVPAQVGLGRARTRLGRLEEARAPLEAALAADPKDTGARVALGELSLAHGDLAAAAQQLEAAYTAAPEDPLAARAWFEVLLRSERSAAAAELAEGLMRRRPEHPLGSFLLAVVMERDGDDEAAQAQYLRTLELDPTFVDAHKNVAILCHTLSRNYTDKVRARLAYEHYAAYFELGGGDEFLRGMYEELLKYREQILGA
ncbi:MAG TPA: tetratricopeptide repeat protein, partial [Planctomycetota bacterium]|nr:tetratricopeptide repeat protein [Planctomycetota bacterium]